MYNIAKSYSPFKTKINSLRKEKYFFHSFIILSTKATSSKEIFNLKIYIQYYQFFGGNFLLF